MRVEVYNNLIYDEKLFIVVDIGTFLDNFVTKDIRMNLYAVDKFYVELIYNSEINKISEIRSFKKEIHLDKYTIHIKL